MKEAVLPFNRFPGVDTLLGPEMRSTGEVMGIGATFGLAFAKSQIAAGNRLPTSGTVFFSLADRDKAAGSGGGPRSSPPWASSSPPPRARPAILESEGIAVATVVAKVGEATRAGSTPSSSSPAARCSWWSTRRGAAGPRADGLHIRATALAHLVPCLTTVAAARAAAAGIADWVGHPLSVRSLQEYHER